MLIISQMPPVTLITTQGTIQNMEEVILDPETELDLQKLEQTVKVDLRVTGRQRKPSTKTGNMHVQMLSRVSLNQLE